MTKIFLKNSKNPYTSLIMMRSESKIIFILIAKHNWSFTSEEGLWKAEMVTAGELEAEGWQITPHWVCAWWLCSCFWCRILECSIFCAYECLLLLLWRADIDAMVVISHLLRPVFESRRPAFRLLCHANTCRIGWTSLKWNNQFVYYMKSNS